jgi:hypothetical protein
MTLWYLVIVISFDNSLLISRFFQCWKGKLFCAFQNMILCYSYSFYSGVAYGSKWLLWRGFYISQSYTGHSSLMQIFNRSKENISLFFCFMLVRFSYRTLFLLRSYLSGIGEMTSHQRPWARAENTMLIWYLR